MLYRAILMDQRTYEVLDEDSSWNLYPDLPDQNVRKVNQALRDAGMGEKVRAIVQERQG